MVDYPASSFTPRGDRIRPESPRTLNRNPRALWIGIGGYFGPESASGFLALPGAELSCFWQDDTGKEREGHLLVLDVSDPIFRHEFVSGEIAGQPRTGRGRKLALRDQQRILAQAKDRGIPTVAAHAANEDYPFFFGQPSSAQFTPRLIEFFNTGIIDTTRKTVLRWGEQEHAELRAYLDLLRRGMDVGVTAGSDFHTDLQNGIVDKAGHTDQWHRYTYVCGLGQGSSRAELLHALFNAQTYAAVEKAALEEMSPEPGLDAKSVPLVKIHAKMRPAQLTLKVGGGQRATLSDKVFLYRIDHPNPVRTWDWPAGHETLTIDYADTDVKDGETYAYVLYSPFQLVTSPIRLTFSPTKARGGATTTTLVLDCSGSMSTDTPDGKRKLEAAKEAAKHYLGVIDFDANSLGADHQVAVVSFSASAEPALSPTLDITQARACIDALSPMSSTNFGSALDTAISWLENLPDDRRKGRKFIIFLSDGMTNTGPVSRAEFLVDDPDRFANPLRLYQRIKRAGIRIYTVGFGDPKQAGMGPFLNDAGLDEEVLRKIAGVPGTGGRYLGATDAFELDEVYVRSFHNATGNVVFESTGTISQGEKKQVGPFNPATSKIAASTGPQRKLVSEIPLLVTPAFADEPLKSQMLVTLGWSIGKLTIELRDPSGRVVDDSYPGAHLKRDLQPVCVAVDSPPVGNWTATISGENVPGAQTRYHLIVSARVPPAPVGGGGVIGGTQIEPRTILLVCLLVAIVALGAACVAVVVRRRAAGVSSAPVLAWLQVHEPGVAPRDIPMTKTVVRIGRDPRSDIVLADPLISASHAEVRMESAGAAVADLGSKNGTWVDGQRITRRALRSGGRITVGDTVLIYFAHGPE